MTGFVLSSDKFEHDLSKQTKINIMQHNEIKQDI